MALSPTDLQLELLARARLGDERAFGALVSPHRRSLEAHCYRMLGSLADADDALQETLVRAWKGLAAWEARGSLRTWLQRIATNVCLDASTRRAARTLPHLVGPPLAGGQPAGPPSPEAPPWLEPAPPDYWLEDGPEAMLTARESVRLAFIQALQVLPPSQRAVLLLREVLGWSADEGADLLETTVAAVNSALQRARATLDERGLATRRKTPDEATARAVLERYIAAWDSGAPELLASVLRRDAVLTMPPMSAWVAGAEAIAGFRQGLGAMGEFRTVLTRASGELAVAVYLRVPGTSHFLPSSIQVLELEGEQVAQVHSFLKPALFPRFGLELVHRE